MLCLCRQEACGHSWGPEGAAVPGSRPGPGAAWWGPGVWGSLWGVARASLGTEGAVQAPAEDEEQGLPGWDAVHWLQSEENRRLRTDSIQHNVMG